MSFLDIHVIYVWSSPKKCKTELISKLMSSWWLMFCQSLYPGIIIWCWIILQEKNSGMEVTEAYNFFSSFLSSKLSHWQHFYIKCNQTYIASCKLHNIQINPLKQSTWDTWMHEGCLEIFWTILEYFQATIPLSSYHYLQPSTLLLPCQPAIYQSPHIWYFATSASRLGPLPSPPQSRLIQTKITSGLTAAKSCFYIQYGP